MQNQQIDTVEIGISTAQGYNSTPPSNQAMRWLFRNQVTYDQNGRRQGEVLPEANNIDQTNEVINGGNHSRVWITPTYQYTSRKQTPRARVEFSQLRRMAYRTFFEWKNAHAPNHYQFDNQLKFESIDGNDAMDANDREDTRTSAKNQIPAPNNPADLGVLAVAGLYKWNHQAIKNSANFANDVRRGFESVNGLPKPSDSQALDNLLNSDNDITAETRRCTEAMVTEEGHWRQQQANKHILRVYFPEPATVYNQKAAQMIAESNVSTEGGRGNTAEGAKIIAYLYSRLLDKSPVNSNGKVLAAAHFKFEPNYQIVTEPGNRTENISIQLGKLLRYGGFEKKGGHRMATTKGTDYKFLQHPWVDQSYIGSSESERIGTRTLEWHTKSAHYDRGYRAGSNNDRKLMV